MSIDWRVIPASNGGTITALVPIPYQIDWKEGVYKLTVDEEGGLFYQFTTPSESLGAASSVVASSVAAGVTPRAASSASE